jgi:nucleoid-associated protein YgaU
MTFLDDMMKRKCMLILLLLFLGTTGCNGAAAVPTPIPSPTLTLYSDSEILLEVGPMDTAKMASGSTEEYKIRVVLTNYMETDIDIEVRVTAVSDEYFAFLPDRERGQRLGVGPHVIIQREQLSANTSREVTFEFNQRVDNGKPSIGHHDFEVEVTTPSGELVSGYVQIALYNETTNPTPTLRGTNLNPTSGSVNQPLPCTSIYTTKEGDTYRDIASEHYGDELLWRHIHRHPDNAGKVPNPDALPRGIDLCIPPRP